MTHLGYFSFSIFHLELTRKIHLNALMVHIKASPQLHQEKNLFSDHNNYIGMNQGRNIPIYQIGNLIFVLYTRHFLNGLKTALEF